jgi:hypothetical protein
VLLRVPRRFQREHVGIGKVRAVFERFIPKPEYVEVDLVTFEQVVVCEAFEPLTLNTFVSILAVEALDELVQIRAVTVAQLLNLENFGDVRTPCVESKKQTSND